MVPFCLKHIRIYLYPRRSQCFQFIASGYTAVNRFVQVCQSEILDLLCRLRLSIFLRDSFCLEYFLMWNYLLLLDLLTFIIRYRGRLCSYMMLTYILSRLQQQCRRWFIVTNGWVNYCFPLFIKHHYKGKSLFEDNICKKNLPHLFCLNGIKCLEVNYEQ